MRASELSFADMAAVEILPALIKEFRYLGKHPEAEAARYAYRLADALAIEREHRNGIREHTIATLTRRAETSDTALQVLRDTIKDMLEKSTDPVKTLDAFRALFGVSS